MDQLLNSLSQGVKDDPTGIDYALETFHSSISAMARTSPNLTAAQMTAVETTLMQKGSEQIVKAGLLGAIERNPDEGVKLAGRYSKYISGQDVKQMESYSRTQKRLEIAEARNAKLWEREQAEARSNDTVGQMLLNLNSEQPSLTKQTINEAYQGGMLTLKGYEHMLRIYEHPPSERIPAGTAQRNAIEAIGDIRAGKITSMDQLYQLMADRKLDYQHFKQVQLEFRTLKDPEGEPLTHERAKFMRFYGEIVNPRDITGQKHESGYRKQFALEQYAIQKQNEMRKAGKDPHDLYNPNSPDFLGKSPAAQGLTPAQLMQEAQERMRASQVKLGDKPPAPDKPPAAYPQAKKAPDGHWYIQIDGKYFRVQ